MIDAIREAMRRIAPYIVRTPVLEASCLTSTDGARVWHKCENLQRTGSFKLRGALNKVLSLSPDALARGVVTSSTGNHGLGVAEALRLAGARGTVVVSSSASPYKIAKLERAGLGVVRHDGDPMGAELAARAMAEREGATYVSPYNDEAVVAGQGTIGLELMEQLPEIDVVYVAVGGGGLIAGIASAVKAIKPTAKIIGCWPSNDAAMCESIRAGHIVDIDALPTISDGTAGNVEPGAITFPLCRDLIDDFVLVPEDAIESAMRDVILRDRLVVEGAAGVAVAAYRALTSARLEMAELPSAIVLCGGNVSAETLARVLHG